LDVLLELYDASGQLVTSANPIDQLSASFSVSVDAGIYYLHVSGVGTGDPTTGYSDYGSIGSYRLSGSFAESNETFPSYLAISALDADRSEGNSGTTAFTFTIQRSGNISGSATVDYLVIGNEAAGRDFAGGSLPAGSVSFAAGESAKTITVSVQGDTAIESDESFTVSLVNPSVGAEIITNSAQGTIRNDDQPGILVSPTSGLTTSESGGTASFSVVLTHAPTADVVIAVASQNTLEGRVDTSTLVFTSSNWNVEQTVVITGVDDATRDGNQTYTVSLGTVDSGDVHYDGLDPADVEVTNLDNDKKGRKGGGGGGSTKGGEGPQTISRR